MKESYLRSRVSLQPLNTSDFKAKKQVLDYQDYEEKLSTYEKNKKLPDITDLFDWTKPSEIINIKQTNKNNQAEPPAMPNNSINTEELLRSEEDDPRSEDDLGLDDSIEVDSPSQHQPSKQSYVQQIRSEYGSEYRLMSQIKLENDLKEMRERIIDMNSQLNKMLDRYELLAGATQKKDVQIVNPHKFLSKQIEINQKLIEKQLQHIKQIQEKDKQLQKKDYLVELADLIEAIKKQIHDLEKEKHSQQVDVDKINKLLKETEQMQEQGDQFKEIKQLKHQIGFYFKKYNEQTATDQQLEKDKFSLIQKEEAMTIKLSEMARVAAQNCLEVSANKPYVQLKRKYDELLVSHESEWKKREVMAKTLRGTQDKLQKETNLLRKQIQECELEIQEVQYRSQECDQQVKDILANNHALNRQMKSISYRFDDSLIHPQKRAHKPDFKRVLSRMERAKQTNTIDYGALEGKNKRFSINDKNSIPYITQSIDNAESVEPSSASRMKPILRSWKSKKGSARYINSPQRQKVVENTSIFKPGPLLKSRK